MDNEQHKINIRKFKFAPDGFDKIGKTKYGENWPVVYIINNRKEAYVGETLNAKARMKQHYYGTPARHDLKHVHVISDKTFNKSVILDLEAFLIKYMASDKKFTLQNGNAGVCDHDYYDKAEYEKRFDSVWDDLMKEKLVIHSLEEIQNSDLFKYSPYKSLTEEQKEALLGILGLLKEHKNDPEVSTILVEGGAGTGKTILAVYLMKLLSEVTSYRSSEEETEFTAEVGSLLAAIGIMDVGFVVPMQSLRNTIQKVFKSVKGLDPKMVISPLQVPDKHYDLLVVDEAHRLRQRRALNQYPSFDAKNRKLGLGKYGTELDWIFQCSDMQILFYDQMQSVKPSDISRSVFSALEQQTGCQNYFLSSQLRCMGGQDYLDYIKALMSDRPPKEMRQFDDYDFLLFDDVKEMTDAIKKKDAEIGLCRNVAGYAWKWVSRYKAQREAGNHDIEIDGHCYDWNSRLKDWINSKKSLDEIGCIHTVQGYDLNYAGVIFGNEIGYDPKAKKITVDRSNYHDHMGKTALKDDEEMKEYIENIYVTLMSRGIKGTYVYVCDDDLREYFRKYVDTATPDMI